jgi:hypothetical protein
MKKRNELTLKRLAKNLTEGIANLLHPSTDKQEQHLIFKSILAKVDDQSCYKKAAEYYH